MARGNVAKAMVNEALKGNTEATAILYNNFSATNHLELRFALDVGSGATKTLKSLVDSHSSSVFMIVEEKTYQIKYQASLSANGGALTHDFQTQTLEKMKQLLNELQVDPAKVKCVGLATAWARNVSDINNLEDYLGKLKNLGIKITPITQKKEGEVGYNAAVQAMKSKGLLGDQKLLVWDIGGGSFQLNINHDNKFNVYNGLYGSGNFSSAIKTHCNISANDGRLLTDAEIKSSREYSKTLFGNALKSDSVMSELSADLKSGKITVAGIGGFLTKGIKPLVGKDSITLDEINYLLDHQDAYHTAYQESHIDPVAASEQLTQMNLLLIAEIMQNSGINKINFLDEAKATVVIASDHKLWTGNELVTKDPADPSSFYLDVV